MLDHGHQPGALGLGADTAAAQLVEGTGEGLGQRLVGAVTADGQRPVGQIALRQRVDDPGQLAIGRTGIAQEIDQQQQEDAGRYS